MFLNCKRLIILVCNICFDGRNFVMTIFGFGSPFALQLISSRVPSATGRIFGGSDMNSGATKNMNRT